MHVINRKVIRRVFYFSVYGTRGGPMRLRILCMLSGGGMNINQLSERLGVDYKTAQHHVRMLEKSYFVKKKATRKETVYFISDLVMSDAGIMAEIRNVGKSR